MPGMKKITASIAAATLPIPGFVPAELTAVKTATVLIAMKSGTAPTAVTVWITRTTNAMNAVNALRIAVTVITVVITAVKKATLSASVVGKNAVNVILMKYAPTVKNIVRIAATIGAIPVSLVVALL